MTRRFIFVAIAGSALLLPGFLLAHHSAAAYVTAKQITVTGNVTEFHFVNPHVLIYITAKNVGGKVRQWQKNDQPEPYDTSPLEQGHHESRRSGHLDRLSSERR